MSADRYPSIFLRQMEVIVYLFSLVRYKITFKLKENGNLTPITDDQVQKFRFFAINYLS